MDHAWASVAGSPHLLVALSCLQQGAEMQGAHEMLTETVRIRLVSHTRPKRGIQTRAEKLVPLV